MAARADFHGGFEYFHRFHALFLWRAREVSSRATGHDDRYDDFRAAPFHFCTHVIRDD